MAKNMAVLENGVVSNIIWCSDALSEGERLKDPGAYLGIESAADFYVHGQAVRHRRKHSDCCRRGHFGNCYRCRGSADRAAEAA